MRIFSWQIRKFIDFNSFEMNYFLPWLPKSSLVPDPWYPAWCPGPDGVSVGFNWFARLSSVNWKIFNLCKITLQKFKQNIFKKKLRKTMLTIYMNSRSCLSILNTCIVPNNSGNTDTECCVNLPFILSQIGKIEEKREHIGSVSI